MQKYANNVQNLAGDAVSGVTITVRFTVGQALATLFSDDGVTPLANPFTNDADGEFFFFAANGVYDVILSGPVTETHASNTLYDPANAAATVGPILVGSTPGPTVINLGEVILVDTTPNAVILTLPLNPGATFQFPAIEVNHVDGDIVANPITIQRNGQLIGGVAADLVLDTHGAAVRFYWAGDAEGWAIQLITPQRDSGNVKRLQAETDGATIFGTLAQLDNSGANTLTTKLLQNSQGGAGLEVIAGGGFRIGQYSAAGVFEESWITADRNGTVAFRRNGVEVARTLDNTAGGFEVDNQSTGAGFERVLTTSDLGGGQIVTDEVTANINIPGTAQVNVLTFAAADQAINTTYALDVLLVLNGANDAFEFDFTGPAGFNIDGISIDTANSAIQSYTEATVVNVGASGGIDSVMLRFYLQIAATTGDFVIRVGRNVLTTGTNTVFDGTWLKAVEV